MPIFHISLVFKHIVDFDKMDNVCMISGFRCGVNEIRVFFWGGAILRTVEW